MGNKGRPVTAQRPSAAGALRSAAGSFGVTSSGGIRRMPHRRSKRRHSGYRMPQIVREQIRQNMEFQRTIATALLLKAGGH